MNKVMKKLLIGISSVMIISCASSGQVKPSMKSGFLLDYSLLTPDSGNNSSLSSYRYVDPNFKRSDYSAVRLNPVIIYQPNTDQNESALVAIKNSLNNYLVSETSKQFNVVPYSGPGIALVQVAITGAEIDGDGFHARNLIPVSAVLKLAAIGTGVDNKKAVLLVEAKITDSQTKKLIGQSLTSISSDSFRVGSKSADAFESAAQIWVKQAVRKAAGYN